MNRKKEMETHFRGTFNDQKERKKERNEHIGLEQNTN